jgi:hypothetical protein
MTSADALKSFRADVAQLVEHSLGKTLRQRKRSRNKKGRRHPVTSADALKSFRADVAQLVEHSLGKGEVTSSILVISSRNRGRVICEL